MRRIFTLFLLLMICSGLSAQKLNPQYDSVMAKRLGADEYGMKNYVFVLLKKGDGVYKDQAQRDSVFANHLRNIGRLVAEGKVIVAGPMGDNDKSYRGIFIFNVKTKLEAKELLLTDPAIANHFLEPELYEWYGSAALPEYLSAHKRIQKYDITDR